MSWAALTRDIRKLARRVNNEQLTTEQLEDAVMIFMRELGFEKDEKETEDVWAEYQHETLDTGHKIYMKGGRFCLDYWFGADNDPLSIPDLLHSTADSLKEMFESINPERPGEPK